MIWQKILELENNNTDYVIVTQVGQRGSAPQDLGAKCLVTHSGLFFGTVGGGKIEARAISYSQQLLEDKNSLKAQVITWNLQKDIGMTCGGEVSFSFEVMRSQNWPIYIFGAGHVAQAVCEILQHLPCQVTCIDPRIEWTSKLPAKIKAVTATDVKPIIENANQNSFFLSITQGHAHDVPILKCIADLHPNANYVGVIGSEIKGLKIKNELKEMGVSDSFIQKLKVPIGLKLGSNHPYEIAISIIAELLQKRDLK